MKGIGRSIRANADLSVWGHMRDAAEFLFDTKAWPLRGIRRDIERGVCAVFRLLFFTFMAVTSPIMIPFAGCTRKYLAVRRFNAANEEEI